MHLSPRGVERGDERAGFLAGRLAMPNGRCQLKSRTTRSAAANRNRTCPISTSLMPISAAEIGSIMLLEFKGQIGFLAAER
jgi:hypothetical protein